MVSRRGRPVVWPAKLLWAPLLASGAWLASGVRTSGQSIGPDAWRVLVSFPAWQDWPGRWTFWPGTVLVLLGVVAWWLYQRPPDSRLLARGAWWTAREHRWFALAAWVFLALAALASIDLSRHVVSMGGRPFDIGVVGGGVGMDWRFLAHERTHWLDRVAMAVSLAGGAACWLLGWGFPAKPQYDQQRSQTKQRPTDP